MDVTATVNRCSLGRTPKRTVNKLKPKDTKGGTLESPVDRSPEDDRNVALDVSVGSL